MPVFFADTTMRLRNFILLWPLLLATGGRAQHYPILPVPGSPHGIVAMFQDSRSRIWVGTTEDVLCFDGSRFYSIRQYGFPKEVAKAIVEDSGGNIWIGTQGDDVHGGKNAGGLYRYKSGRVEKVKPGNVLSIVSIARGVLLASFEKELGPTLGDVYRIREDKGEWRTEKMFDGPTNYLTVDHAGAVVYPCSSIKGWCELSRQQVIDWTRQNIDPKMAEAGISNNTMRAPVWRCMATSQLPQAWSARRSSCDLA